MPKYIFKPIVESVIEHYKENSGGADVSENLSNGFDVELIVSAENEEHCKSIQSLITFYPDWQLISTIE
jgi:hypothetical protein